ncbi:hypothetical protein RHGRI_025808 [Rhododendron griersonianum]|uniref:Uncharacterized protein n=1 Tax=Rhododendron griersonianum TaxID=479676 RepID=A0AAV6IQF4_9ERIC|nr:hypothetical protein RHGRI_025808 [Rhododendron griersonianum]
MHSPVLSDWGFLRKTSRRQKTIKPFVVEASGGEEEGDETDMGRIRVKPTNVERGARMKQKEVDLDDAEVEDTPPSKIKAKRLQETHDEEGYSKVRTRSGSVARGNKATHPRLDVKESAPKRTRSGSEVRGIKAKQPRLDVEESVPKCSRSGSEAREIKAK